MHPVPFEQDHPEAAEILAMLCRPGHEAMKQAWRGGIGGKFIHWKYRKGRPAMPTKVTVGRNAPCPCGSGRKFKKCCMYA